MIGKRILIPRLVESAASRSRSGSAETTRVSDDPHIVMVTDQSWKLKSPKSSVTIKGRVKGTIYARIITGKRPRPVPTTAYALTYEPEQSRGSTRAPVGTVLGVAVGRLLNEVAHQNPKINGDLTRLANSGDVAVGDFVRHILDALKAALPKVQTAAAEVELEAAVPENLRNALSRGAELKRALYGSEEMQTAAQVAAALDVTTARVSQMAAEKRLFSIKHPINKTHVRYPEWQLESPVFDALPDLLKALNGLDGWTIRHFFVSGDSSLRGLSPLEVLRGQAAMDAHQDRLKELLRTAPARDLVLAAARSYAEGGC